MTGVTATQHTVVMPDLQGTLQPPAMVELVLMVLLWPFGNSRVVDRVCSC